jgi:8-oxo-dGTP diphosphatase
MKTVNVVAAIICDNYDYETFHLHMHCFWATVLNGHLSLLEHEAAKWVTRDGIDDVNWLPADEGLISMIKKYLY